MVMKRLLLISLLVLFTTSVLTSIGSEYDNDRKPTWGVKPREFYEYRLEICRKNGIFKGIDYPIYVDTIDHENDLYVQEAETWKVIIEKTNESGVFGVIELKDCTSPIFNLFYTTPSIFDTHNDNETYWEKRVDHLNEISDKSSSAIQAEVYNAFLDNNTLFEYQKINLKEFKYEIWTESDISKGIVINHEFKFLSKNEFNSGSNPDHFKIVLISTGEVLLEGLDYMVIIEGSIIIVTATCLGVFGIWFLFNKRFNTRDELKEGKKLQDMKRNLDGTSLPKLHSEIGKESIQKALQIILEIQEEVKSSNS